MAKAVRDRSALTFLGRVGVEAGRSIWSIGGLACAFAMYHETEGGGEKEEGEERELLVRRLWGPLGSLPIGPRIDSRNWPPKNARYCTMQMRASPK